MVTHRRFEVAAVAVGAPVLHHVADAGLVRVEAGQQAGPGRAAAGGVVELGEPEPAGGERVQVRRADLAAVAAEVGEAHVVGQDDDDVGPRRGIGGRRGGRRGHHEEEGKGHDGAEGMGTPGGRSSVRSPARAEAGTSFDASSNGPSGGRRRRDTRRRRRALPRVVRQVEEAHRLRLVARAQARISDGWDCSYGARIVTPSGPRGSIHRPPVEGSRRSRAGRTCSFQRASRTVASRAPGVRRRPHAVPCRVPPGAARGPCRR